MLHILHWAATHFNPSLVFYTVIVLLLLYKPPVGVSSRLQGLGDFITRHWGDSIGLYFLHLGIILKVVGGVYSFLSDAGHVGESLILTGVGMLKLKYIPKENGTTTSTTSTTSSTGAGGEGTKG